jgi:deoxyribose-phosphate aldolase
VGFGSLAASAREVRPGVDVLMKEELGDAWLTPALFRVGASGLLTDIERQLEHHATGRYAAAYRPPLP